MSKFKIRALEEYINDIERSSVNALKFVHGITFHEFSANTEKQYAVNNCIIIAGEACSKIIEFYKAFAMNNMKVMKALKKTRNRLAHEYFKTDTRVIWNTATIALPQLSESLTGLKIQNNNHKDERKQIIAALKGLPPDHGMPPSNERLLAIEIEKRPDISLEAIKQQIATGNTYQYMCKLRKERMSKQTRQEASKCKQIN